MLPHVLMSERQAIFDGAAHYQNQNVLVQKKNWSGGSYQTQLRALTVLICCSDTTAGTDPFAAGADGGPGIVKSLVNALGDPSSSWSSIIDDFFRSADGVFI